MAKELDLEKIPDELRVLLPELNREIVIIGSKAYEMYPINEGKLEKISVAIALAMAKVFSADLKCPKCGKVVKNGARFKIEKCDVDGEYLDTASQSPIEALVSSGQIPMWIEEILGVDAADIKAGLTVNQIRHFAGVFWKQNFSDDGLPQVSKENFTRLLKTMGLGQEKKETTPTAEKKEPPLPESPGTLT